MPVTGVTKLPTWTKFACSPVYKYHLDYVGTSGFISTLNDRVWYLSKKPELPDVSDGTAFGSRQSLTDFGGTLVTAKNASTVSTGWVGQYGWSSETVDGQMVSTMLWVKGHVKEEIEGTNRIRLRGATYKGYYFKDHYEMGNVLGTVSSEERDTYPDDGIKGEYWYTWKGYE